MSPDGVNGAGRVAGLGDNPDARNAFQYGDEPEAGDDESAPEAGDEPVAEEDAGEAADEAAAEEGGEADDERAG